MNARRLSAAALIVATTIVAGCGNDSAPEESSIAWSPVTGDEYTDNPGSWQTDGVPVPPKDVTMVGDPVAAQAVANAGLEQGTITASAGDTTVYYPKAPEIPGLPVAPEEVAPPPPQLQRPAETRPWNYTPYQIAAYRQICETGRWRDWSADVTVQSQTCWTVYGRRLGVRPWYPGQPKPWEQPTWPKPWYEPDFRADVPVMWVYPTAWSAPRPQPLISVSIGLNVPDNPHARPHPRHRDELFYPVWAVTPGRTVTVRDQARVVAPWVPAYATSTTVTTTTYVAPPVYPGLTLATIPASGRAELMTAEPGSKVAANPNIDASVRVPTAAAIKGATVYGSRAELKKVFGDDVDVRVATTTRKRATGTSKSAATTTTTKARTTTKAPASEGSADATTTKPRSSSAERSTTGAASPADASTTTGKSSKTAEKSAGKTTTRTATKTTSAAKTTTPKKSAATTSAKRTSAATTTTPAR